LFDDSIDTTNITNVLLIDKDTLDYEVFYNSCNETTFPIVYSRTCNRNDLLQLLNNKFTKIDRLCFVFSLQPSYVFLNNELLFTDNESSPYSENVTFIINLIHQFNISTVDYLACDTLNYVNWQNYYNIILSNTTAILGASNDRTGNLKYGGDWTMESTGQDIETIYFNSQIQNYQKLLDYIGPSNVFLMDNNTIYGFGSNTDGQLGLGYTSTSVNTMVQMPNTTGKTPVAVSCGTWYTLVLMSDGTIYGTGQNTMGQLGIGNTTNQSSLTIMINTTGKTPVSISCGWQSTIVLMSDGTVYGCGKNDKGQLGIGSTSNRNTLTQMNIPSGKTPVMVNTGLGHTLVLMSDGTIYGCGNKPTIDYGIAGGGFSASLQLVPNSTGKTPSVIYSAVQSSFVLMTDSTVYAVGYNGYLGVAQGTSPVASFQQVINNTGKTFVDIYHGYLSRVFLMNDRTIYSIGNNYYGQLGVGDTTDRYTLTQLINTTGKTPVAITTGNNHTIVLMSDGTIYGTGENLSGQLGDGTLTSRNTLTLIPNNTGLNIKSFSGSRPKIYKLTPTISGFSIPSKSLNNGPFTITQPTSNSVGSFSYSSSNTSVATISGNTITIVGIGTTTITATQAETTYCSSGTATTTFIVDNPTPSLSNFSIPTKTVGNTPFTITPPTSNSDGSFSYSSSNTSVATISGNTITIVGAGTATIIAIQSSTLSYGSGTITASFQVNKATTSISSFSIPTKTFGNTPFTITSPTSNSNGSFSYSSSDESVATISGNIITIVGAGTTTITASQAETTSYTSATLTTTFQVSKATPSITGFSIPTKTYGDSSFTISDPSSNSTGTFTYSSSNTSVATISGNTITIVGPGTVTITASQGDSTNFNSGTQTTTFQVDKITPSITNFSVSTRRFGTSPFIITPPTSTSNGTFSYTSSDTSVATVSGSTITIVGAGTATITSSQAEAAFYKSGTLTTTIQVSKGIPSISSFSIPTKNYGDSAFTITPPTSNINGSFSYVSSDTSVATISGNTVTIVGQGTTTITATQAETTNYISGTIIASFQVSRAVLSISDFSISTKTYGDSPFTITPPASNSNGSFSYISADPSVATISGDTITIVGVGTASILAVQEKTSNYASGTITTSFQVDKATPSISGFSISTKTVGDSPFPIIQPASNSNGTFSYISTDPLVATISGNTVTIVGAGTVTILAIQEATSNYTSGITSFDLQVLSA
jgi:alpha-tubulin suppressor-like RCC1 family protein